MFNLTGKRALVTGSSTGLGLTFARGLAQAGAAVVLNGRNEAKLSAAESALKEEGVECYAVPFDVTRDEQVQKAVQHIEDKIGAIDILVNNAGINIRKPTEEMELEDWQKVIDINLTGAFIVSKHVGKGMIKRRSGKIINICSLMSEVGRETIVPYTAAKGGLKMLTKGLAVDWGKYNIQVNGIGPGYFLTELTRPLADNPEFDDWLKKRTPVHRWGKPEELVGTLIYLASPASDFVTGQIIYVDGGILAGI